MRGGVGYPRGRVCPTPLPGVEDTLVVGIHPTVMFSCLVLFLIFVSSSPMHRFGKGAPRTDGPQFFWNF